MKKLGSRQETYFYNELLQNIKESKVSVKELFNNLIFLFDKLGNSYFTCVLSQTQNQISGETLTTHIIYETTDLSDSDNYRILISFNSKTSENNEDFL